MAQQDVLQNFLKYTKEENGSIRRMRIRRRRFRRRRIRRRRKRRLRR